MEIKPAEYNVSLQFIETEDDDMDSDVVFALVKGIGKEVKSAKKGDTVLVHKHAKEDGIKVDDTHYIIGAWCIVGVVSDD